MGLKGVLTHSMSHKQRILVKSNIAALLFLFYLPPLPCLLLPVSACNISER